MVLIRERPQPTVETIRDRTLSGEAMAFCPGCKAFQTLWFTSGKLTPTRKFKQLDEHVYHDCGSKEPCLFYRIF